MYYNSFNAAMRNRFGTKVYKLALDGGFTCPNRDGTLDTRGCIFCSGHGSGDFSQPFTNDIPGQIQAAKALVSGKIKQGKYIAYFQSFTNTYAGVQRLKDTFTPAIMHPDTVAISIATRPDCLEDEKIRLLENLNKIKPVWVELGLQTINPKTARYIRRGYDLPVYDDAVKRLKQAGLEIIVHMIIGLPGETEDDLYATAEYISSSGVNGIKLQLLHVLKGTDLYNDYMAGKFHVLELDEYIHILENCLERISPEIVIHRLTGDGAKRELAAPVWSGNKKMVLNAINAAFNRDNLIQGKLCTHQRL